MTSVPLEPPSARAVVNWAAVSAIAVLLIQFAGVVTFGARASAEIAELKATTEPLRTSRGALTTRLDKLEETTQPLREGALVKIETDVAWIRQEMERERTR